MSNEELKPTTTEFEEQEDFSITQEQGTESTKDFIEQIIKESEGEVATFAQEGEQQLAQVEVRAEEVAATIGNEDKNALQALNTEAAAAQEQLVVETVDVEASDSIPTPNESADTTNWIELGADHVFDEEGFYRVVNERAYQDYRQTKILRASPDGTQSRIMGKIDIGHRQTAFPSFSKGSPDLTYTQQGVNNYIFESATSMYKRGEVNPKSGQAIRGRHWAYRPIDQITGEVITKMTPDMVRNIYKVDAKGKLYRSE